MEELEKLSPEIWELKQLKRDMQDVVDQVKQQIVVNDELIEQIKMDIQFELQKGNKV
jgi:hypothetical protein